MYIRHREVHSGVCCWHTCFLIIGFGIRSSAPVTQHERSHCSSCSKQIISSQSTGTGFPFVLSVADPHAFLTRMCVSVWSYLILQLIWRVKPGTDNEDCWPIQLHVQRLFPGHLLSQPSIKEDCLANCEQPLIKVDGWELRSGNPWHFWALLKGRHSGWTCVCVMVNSFL